MSVKIISYTLITYINYIHNKIICKHNNNTMKLPNENPGISRLLRDILVLIAP